MPSGLPPDLRQEQVLDYSFMEIKSLKELVELEEEGPSSEPPETDEPKKFSNMTTLRISSNSITDIAPLYDYLDQVAEGADTFKWLDLSYNKIERIGLSFDPFKNVSVLYMQANLISRFGELKPLTKLPHLTNLALHGNPVAAKKHYRNYVLHLLPNLTKLDFSCITKQDRVHSQTWAMFFRKKLAKKVDEE
ncbi:hypothetical protein TrCOL_g1600 [Triparma columacea]|uniref:U2A'/phosphoprotein 32 family A C-terminal domain-containing protein n=1 Tax=Triparma columacea TaxID=722753 RepID=A0A9W7GK21_9STRA|nr:hypothetical protein TrCOL_g1600 [Triparma columacea]